MGNKLAFAVALVIVGGLLAQTCAFEPEGFFDAIMNNQNKAILAAVFGGLIGLVIALFVTLDDEEVTAKEETEEKE